MKKKDSVSVKKMKDPYWAQADLINGPRNKYLKSSLTCPLCGKEMKLHGPRWHKFKAGNMEDSAVLFACDECWKKAENKVIGDELCRQYSEKDRKN